MDPTLVGIIGLAVALLLIALRTPIAFALGAVAITCIFIFFAFPASGGMHLQRAIKPTLTLSTGTMFELFHSYSLSAIPMFVALGHISYKAGITSDIYFAARAWLNRVPGGLAMASVIGCGGFAAISGSSLACAATMGRVAVPEMQKHGYSDALATGSVAAGGTLGSLIPPSILFILYGVFAEESISSLFIAGVIPGLLSMAGYWLVIAIWASVRPQDAASGSQTFRMSERMMALVNSWPALLIFLIIIGGIYGGIFTATEAAGVSFVVVTVISFVTKRITLKEYFEAIKETAYQTAAIFLIAGAAKIFVTFVSLTGVTNAMLVLVQSYDPSAAVLLIGIAVIYLIMGMFLDPLGILLLTLPFVLPLMEQNGYNLIWFGVIVVKLLEIGLITPPVGLNVFVINSVTEPKVPVGRIFAGVTPFFAMDLVVLGLLLAFPALSLWLT
ncbi:TRAP transporter large permease [Thalassovita taeanensis]|uniref:TRAP transporter large permease protein n=1 Tax=Thalassovita taeanensis TaxID=657014 RepID=A0A1H9BWZ8_9RHOB|nr:TRAP transporter large permease [Thalassovita taeanensis]SEP93093.1 TRAP transporter, DctM subunit [Thalassovita taeanensis]